MVHENNSWINFQQYYKTKHVLIIFVHISKMQYEKQQKTHQQRHHRP